jgi:hypothetical protein
MRGFLFAAYWKGLERTRSLSLSKDYLGINLEGLNKTTESSVTVAGSTAAVSNDVRRPLGRDDLETKV